MNSEACRSPRPCRSPTAVRPLFVRKETKTYGTCLAVEGGDLRGRKRVAIVEDVISAGRRARPPKARLDEVGAITVAVVCAVWRADRPPAIEGLDVPVFRAALTPGGPERRIGKRPGSLRAVLLGA